MNKRIASLIAITTSLYAPLVSSAGIQTQLDNIFVEMETFTQPGKFESQRRSAYFGGRYTYKTQIFNENLIQLELPSARGGCGGIDMFGGSFSFANSEQIETLLRSIASNARGYAFQLALSVMCDKCMSFMGDIQKKIQELNQFLGNSCQLAQGIVNDVASLSPWKNKEIEKHMTEASALDGAGDLFGLKTGTGSTKTAEEARKELNPDKFNSELGAVVYKAFQKHTAASWFTGGDDELLESIMTMTGSVVVGDLVTGEEGLGQTTDIWPLPAGELKMRDLIFGAENKHIYDCSKDTVTDHCIIKESHTKPIVKLESLREKLLEVLVGPDSIIDRFKTKNVAGAPSEKHQNILAGLPQSIGSKIFELGPLSPGAAEEFVENFINPITLEYVYRFVREAFRAVNIAMANTKHTYKTPTFKMIKEAEETLREEYLSLSAEFGFTIKEVESHYADIIAQHRAKQYLSANPSGQKQP
ncbi:MAG: conjugal transfer protein TraH [Cellvibrionaceae bacterium]|nr:conjugal transfer protein TraH [Cellvibrionaceae bacterium]